MNVRRDKNMLRVRVWVWLGYVCSVINDWVPVQCNNDEEEDEEEEDDGGDDVKGLIFPWIYIILSLFRYNRMITFPYNHIGFQGLSGASNGHERR